MKKIFITGISGTGKTAVAGELEKKGIHAISVDEVTGLCSWVDKKTKKKVSYDKVTDAEFVKNHDWVCDVPQLTELMSKSGDMAVVLGIVSNQKDFLHLFDKILLLQCPPEVFIKRIESRTGNDFGKDKTTQGVLLGWYKAFEKDVLDVGAIPIDAAQSLGEVVEQVIKEIQS